MCLMLLAYDMHPGYRLVLAANRDEFLDRPAAPLDYNYPGEEILAGKDLRGGGTWLGLTGDGRFGGITNYRNPSHMVLNGPSRGEILLNYFRSDCGADAFLSMLAAKAHLYSGFNLLLADEQGLWYFSNITGKPVHLSPGVYGLSNHLLDTPWPKLIRGKTMLQHSLAMRRDPDHEHLLEMLTDSTRPPDRELPETGVGLDWERLLSTMFIHSPTYGTRSSAVISMTSDGRVRYSERTYDHAGGVHCCGDREYRL